MTEFEQIIERTFPAIRAKTGAFLYWLYPKTRMVGMRGTMPCFAMVGRALFDVAGWLPKTITDHDGYDRKVNLAVGIEVKETSKLHSSMRIVGDDGSGSGLQAHQLEALAAVHRDGGIARLVWNNGGMVGMITGEQLAHIHFTYGVSVQAEKMRKVPSMGSRSIPWNQFIKFDFDENPHYIVQEALLPPTLAEELKAKRKKNSKKIEKAATDDDDVDPAAYEDADEPLLDKGKED